VGHLVDRVGCTLVRPEWVLTAAHTIESSLPFQEFYVTFDGVRYPVEKGIIHPDRVRDAVDPTADLLLLKLAKPVAGIAPLPLYDRTDEAGMEIVVVGRGGTGTGLTGPAGERDHVLRAATNRIDTVTATTLEARFDAPPEGGDLEGSCGPGDSGGPALVERDGKLYVAGVASTNSGSAADGTAAKYGTVDAYTRVSTRLAWIEKTIAADPPTMLWGALTRAVSEKLPATPAGRIAAAFVAAFDSADEKKLAAFFERYGPPASTAENDASARKYAGLSRDYGGYEVKAFKERGPGDLAVYVVARKTGKWRGILIAVDAKGDARFRQLAMGDVEAPAESR
jgi:hypothetical protein